MADYTGDMDLSTPISGIKGVGEALARKFAVLGVREVRDLVEFYPYRYEDYSTVVQIANLRPGAVTIKAKIKQVKGRYVRRGLHITEAVASDETSSVRIIWFNQPYRANSLKPGQEYYISGEFGLSYQRLQITNPSAELVSDFPINTARILPVYHLTKGLTSKQIRKVAKSVVSLVRQLPENLPDWIVSTQKLMSRAAALEAVHFPESNEQLTSARRRLGFEEVFNLSLASQLVKKELAVEMAPEIPFNAALAREFVASLPFSLTNDQRKVAWQIFQDIEQSKPMNRLVEGDVGSGKTVVAAMAAVMAMTRGKQVALMAPTEILARQHAETLAKLLKPHELDQKLGLLVGSMKPAEKAAAHKAIMSGQMRFVVGTHALISEQVDFSDLALVIVDEQHRFGVAQRQKLQKKAGHAVHTLNLTATPIPRSLALVVYGELDVSILAEKPPGRTPVETKLIPPTSRKELFAAVKTELDAGRQMFVVCPLISESDLLDANSAEKIYEQFSAHEFKGYKIGLLHGQMKSDQKERVMADFVAGRLDILVSTTVIEVGVDVPNASVMMIEAPERFGLAQIHQLRGRVGRGSQKSYCYLLLNDSKAPSRRLKALEKSSNGFDLAELDLELRGPGALYGQMQSGQLDLRIANLADTKLTLAARDSAKEFIDRAEDLANYPDLNAKVTSLQAVTTLN